MKIHMPEKYYETPSLEISSYLQCKGHAVVDVKRQGTQTIFLLENNGTIRQLVNQYYLRDSVPALDHWNAIKALKSRIYQ